MVRSKKEIAPGSEPILTCFKKETKVSPEAVDFIERCLIIDPMKRLTPDEAINHKWFQSI